MVDGAQLHNHHRESKGIAKIDCTFLALLPRSVMQHACNSQRASNFKPTNDCILNKFTKKPTP
jgi:hypothetical protein